MGLLDRLMRRKATEESEQSTETASQSCPHTALGPRWDNAEDIGNESKATSYRCESCGDTFSREEAERLRAEGLKATLSRDD